MRHFHRTNVPPVDVLGVADAFFPSIGLSQTSAGPRERRYRGPLGSVTLRMVPEGGHYTFVDAETDQVGESRLDKNVKRFFVQVHRAAEPAHRLRAGY